MTSILKSLRLAWWNGLWKMRPAGRLLLRRPKWAARAVTGRNAWHWILANLVSLAVKAVLWIAFDPKVALILGAAYALMFFLAYSLATNGGPPSRFLMRWRICRAVFGWKLAWRFRARWPMEWSIGAAKTRAVQAEVGTSAEPAVTIRPIFDAPKMSWWPQMQWPVISWWVSPPPGRTFAQFESMLDVLASNLTNVVGLTLDYERSTSSIGRLSVLFDDPLADPIVPDYHVANDDPAFAEDPIEPAEDMSVEDLADVVDLRPLRLVQDPDNDSEVS